MTLVVHRRTAPADETGTDAASDAAEEDEQ